jgi:phenylacetate-CoA ligase
MTRLTWWPTKLVHVDATYLQPAAIENFVEEINRQKPRMIEGFVGSLHEVAAYAQSHGLTMHKPHALGTTAAPLTAEGRAHLEASYGAPAHDQYRSAEVPWMAGECGRRDGLHVFADVRRIEMTDDSGSPVPVGTSGNVVISDLVNWVFPLVRYRLGDISSLREEPCPCGVTLPLMDQPDGRTVDLIRLPDGTTIGAGLFGIFAGVPEAVRLFQLHQNADFSILLRIVQGPSPTAHEQVDAVVVKLRERFKGQVPVSVEYVDSLPFTGGKIKYVTSDIKATA